MYLQVKRGRTPPEQGIRTIATGWRAPTHRCDCATGRGVSLLLYFGKDFFEAVCARKSWECTMSFLDGDETTEEHERRDSVSCRSCRCARSSAPANEQQSHDACRR